MSENKLTKRQQEILDFVQSNIRENGYSPSVREICVAMGLSSTSTVHAHLNALEQKGFIKHASGKSRSVVLTSEEPEKAAGSSVSVPSDASFATLPLVGRVAAGEPILAEQNIEEEIPMPQTLVGDKNSFMLKVSGESMIGAGIFDGDMVIVREQKSADNGDIVVALIDDGATVKTYYKEKDCVRLQPQNPTMEPIFTRDAQILGVVTGLFRSF